MSDRQLNSLEWHRLRVSGDVAISQGRAWEHVIGLTLGNGGVDTFEFLVGPLPWMLYSAQVTTTGSRGVLLESFIGGDVIQGLPVPEQYPMNHDRFEANPLARFSFPAIINTPGTKIGESLLGESARGTSQLAALSAIYSAGTQYYYTMTNTDTQSADIDVEIVGYAIADRPPGL
jgi:hypothetical protein